MASQPDHKVAFSALNKACTHTILNVEKQLDEQRELDTTKVRRQEEEKRQKEEMARLAAEQEEKEQLEWVWKMEEEHECYGYAIFPIFSFSFFSPKHDGI